MPGANAKGKPGVLELPEETRDRLAELKVLSDRAEAGDREARRELRRLVRASSHEVIGRASDVRARRGKRWPTPPRAGTP